MSLSIFQRVKIALMRSALTRTEYIVRHHIFSEVGENFFFQPRILPINDEYIKFHNNVAVASNVTFCNHDVLHKVLNNLDPSFQCKKKYGCIEVMDNVFIGANSTILYDVRIGPNAVVAAGSVVVKDVPPGSVVGGVPARVIGSFDDLLERRKRESDSVTDYYDPKEMWELFYQKRNSKMTLE